MNFYFLKAYSDMDIEKKFTINVPKIRGCNIFIKKKFLFLF